ncbi:urease accessory protein UreF [Deinococcus aquiradiocola]|uniref:Urease accessory protein UreF n=1 Tax=Deinococcus aquiradiocola TaxID=393059 RepID=A0A917UTS3_9DEIO|nr:urease accessory UreF family protein [Deinococcus aquiradiocola]GGJ84585.1 urease accessory protein UreF [Deinococcus aquiradiocola]
MTTLALLRLLQLADSAFPAGAYAFSDGLETLVVRGEVRDAGDLRAFLHGQLVQGWGRCDPGACALAWAVTDDAGAGGAAHPGLERLDALLDLLKPVASTRNASARVGVNVMRAAGRLWPQLVPGPGGRAVGARHHATAFGLVARQLGATQEDAVAAFVSGWLLGRAVSATRLMRLGGMDAQRAVSDLDGAALACVRAALTVTPDDLGGFAPTLDVAACEQASLDVRLFQS